MKIIDTDIAIDHFHGRRAASYLRQFRPSQKLEIGDTLIAATAAHHNAELVTRNRKHYPMQDIVITTPYTRGK